MPEGDYKPVPVSAARKIGFDFNKQVVVIISWDRVCGKIHTTTWGEAAREKEWAAQLGPILAAAAGGDVSRSESYEDFRADKSAAENAEIVEIINELRREEGNSVVLLCDNPDFGGPGCAVEVSAEWTDWREQRFNGDNMLDALRAARKALHERMTPPEKE